jgi:rRNA maturation endonuclease Nob1
MTDAIDTDDFLAHFGIKGMKWGVRHAIGPAGRVTQKRVLSPSDEAREIANLRKKHVSELSNAELKKLTTRVDLEQKYNKINPSTIKKGKIAVTAIIATATTLTTVYNLVNSPASKWAVKFVNQKVLKKGSYQAKLF